MFCVSKEKRFLTQFVVQWWKNGKCLEKVNENMLRTCEIAKLGSKRDEIIIINNIRLKK